METTKLKRFATEARVNLMEGVKRKLRLLGFDESGQAVSEPQLVQGAALWKGEEYPEDFYNQWKALQQRLSEKGLREVAEEAAYTWFNRMIAIRILSMNGFCEPILRLDPSTGLPNLLANARMGRIPEMTIQLKHRFEVLMDDDTKSNEQFALLLTAWCHDNPIINACFGSINDYVELLLPDNILRPDGFLSLLNETDFISEEDYKSAELIGWLYQFYISDRKDEVFAKKGKVEAEEIPAATQIFTPNWIVKYMVQNTILPQVEAPEEIIEKAKYLVKVEGADKRKVELEDLKVADFACGSGHILNECFDLLFELYRSEAYSRKEAIEYIFTKNLTGVDIDLRAKQLTTFALLLKACQKDESFIDAHCLPHIITVPSLDSVYFNGEEIDAKEFIHHFFKGTETKECVEQLNEAIKLVAKADSLGSIIKFNLSSSTRRQLVETVSHWKNNEEQSVTLKKHLKVFDFILTLSEMYDVIVMNPPYMGNKKMDSSLKDYVDLNYPNTCNDLGSVFMETSSNRLIDGGKVGLINMAAWLFKPAYQNYREYIIENNRNYDSVIYLGPGVFEELKGEVVQNVVYIQTKSCGEISNFIYLKNYSNEVRIKKLESKDFSFYKYPITYFNLFPKRQFGFWIPENVVELLSTSSIGKLGRAKQGLKTGDNPRFIRNWYEVSIKKINTKWFLLENGGLYRKWYGNTIAILNWENNGFEIKNFKDENGNLRSRPQGLDFSFREGLTWSTSATDNQSFRYSDNRVLFESSGSKFCLNGEEKVPIDEISAFLNSPVSSSLLEVFSPGLGISEGAVNSLPYIKPSQKVSEISLINRIISKEDWDAHETSWDFETNELVRIKKEDLRIKNIEDSVNEYKKYWADKFFQLHRNEEELNRQFIEIYGLQDELNPHVEYEDITILQQGEISLYRPTHAMDMYNFSEEEKQQYIKAGGIIEDDMVIAFQSLLSWNEDVIIKQLISYIVGVYMGRYRLDKPGFNIAYPEPSEEDLAPYDFKITQDETMTIDPDAIIPVLPKDAPFYDNLYNYVVEFIGKVWGQNELTENLNFLEKALGKSLDDYLLKDFWKDHKKMYQNRPIYWEFASKKGTFKAIIYAHRMDKYTVEVLRSKYVLPYIRFIENKISTMESREQELSTKERRELDNLRTKIIPELEEYHSRVEQIAAETAARPQVFDLDDGIPHNHSLFGDIVTKLK